MAASRAASRRRDPPTDTPADGDLRFAFGGATDWPADEPLRVLAGWCFGTGAVVRGVELRVGGAVYGADYGLPRPDVAALPRACLGLVLPSAGKSRAHSRRGGSAMDEALTRRGSRGCVVQPE